MKEEGNGFLVNLDIDRIVHEPARLKIMAQLYVVEKADFIFIMRQTGMTQGNVSGHLAKLEEAQYIKVKKGFVGKRPQTMLSLTEKGKQAFEHYIQMMRQMIDEFEK